MKKSWRKSLNPDNSSTLLNLEVIEFPSDKLTVKAMLQRFPVELDIDHPNNKILPVHEVGPEEIMLDAVDLLKSEHNLAENAFAIANGGKKMQLVSDKVRKETVAEINKQYCRFGLSTGLKQTHELVRKFENEAAQQAKQQVH